MGLRLQDTWALYTSTGYKVTGRNDVAHMWHIANADVSMMGPPELSQRGESGMGLGPGL